MTDLPTTKHRNTSIVLRARQPDVFLTSTGALVQKGTSVVRTLVGSENLTSTSHLQWPKPPRPRKRLGRKMKKPRFHKQKAAKLLEDKGGPFSLVRTSFTVAAPRIKSTFVSGTLRYVFDDHVWPVVPSTWTTATLPLKLLDSTLDAKGAVGWYRFKPTAQHGQLGQAIVELRDFPRLPHILTLWGNAHAAKTSGLRDWFRPKKRRATLPALGDEYVNWAFGWAPLISDVTDLAKNVLKAEKRLHQLAIDNGKWIRRKGTISQTHSSSKSSITGQNWFMEPSGLTGPAGWVVPGSTTVEDVTVQSERYWFSGAFKYWIGMKPDVMHRLVNIPERERFQLTRILYGVDPTDPSLLWELFPWSWLVDWVVPIGPIIDNIYNDSADNLVAAYAYSMAHVSTQVTRTVTARLADGQTVSTSASCLQETKQRRKANPYGFGISYSGLSASRLAILSALGSNRLID